MAQMTAKTRVAGLSGEQQRRVEAALDVLGYELLNRSAGPAVARPAPGVYPEPEE